MEKSGNHYLHDCPNVVDNYGMQAVEPGEKCPFCGEQAPKEEER